MSRSTILAVLLAIAVAALAASASAQIARICAGLSVAGFANASAVTPTNKRSHSIELAADLLKIIPAMFLSSARAGIAPTDRPAVSPAGRRSRAIVDDSARLDFVAKAPRANPGDFTNAVDVAKCSVAGKTKILVAARLSPCRRARGRHKMPGFVTRRCRPARGFRPGGRGHIGVNADAMAPPPQGCHLYFARRVTFLSCADTRMRRVTHEARRPSSAHGIAAPRRALLRALPRRVRHPNPFAAPWRRAQLDIISHGALRCDHVHGCPAGSETAESRLPDPVLFQYSPLMNACPISTRHCRASYVRTWPSS